MPSVVNIITCMDRTDRHPVRVNINRCTVSRNRVKGLSLSSTLVYLLFRAGSTSKPSNNDGDAKD